MSSNSSIDYLWFFLSVYITVASDQHDSIKLYAQGSFLIPPRREVFKKSLRSALADKGVACTNASDVSRPICYQNTSTNPSAPVQ